MKKTEINWGKIAYVPVPNNVLFAISGLGFSQGDGQVCVGGPALEGFEDDDKEIENFVKSIYEQAGDYDIIFHK